MPRFYYTNQYYSPQYTTQQSEERFIGPIFPFLGGALIGYIAGRPQQNYGYPIYYPYYPYYPTYYYRQPSTYNNPNLNNYTN